MATDVVRGLLNEQRKRLVANLLGFMEHTPWWQYLTADDKEALRNRVFLAASTYHDVALDLLKVLGEGVLINEDAVRLIQATHDRTRALERRLDEWDEEDITGE